MDLQKSKIFIHNEAKIEFGAIFVHVVREAVKIMMTLLTCFTGGGRESKQNLPVNKKINNPGRGGGQECF